MRAVRVLVVDNEGEAGFGVGVGCGYGLFEAYFGSVFLCPCSHGADYGVVLADSPASSSARRGMGAAWVE